MGRHRNPGPKYPTKAHKGELRVWWNGRYHRLGPASESAKCKAECARLVQLWEHDPTASPMRPDDYLVATLCREYLASDKCRPSTRYAVGRAVTQLLETHSYTTVAEFDAVAFAAWQAALCRAADDAGRKVYSVSTVRKRVGVVKKIWKWGVATKRVPVERWQELLAVEGLTPGPEAADAGPARRVPPARPKHVEAAVPHMRGPVAAMVQLQLLAGFRPSELFRLTPEQVHRSGVVDVPEVGEVDLDELGVWVYLPDAHKTSLHGKPRWVILGSQAQAVLAPFVDRGADVACFSPREALTELRLEQRAARKSKVQPSQLDRRKPGAKPRGVRYNRVTYRQAVHRACERAEVPAWNAYQLRQRHAADVDAALGLDAAQASLGHANPQTTRRYSKQSFSRAAEVAKTLG